MKVIAKYLGGSRSYGLSTPESDNDERYLFLNTEVSRIIGLDRHEHQCRQNETEDSFGWELRHFLNLLRKGNTGALELLNNNNWQERTEEFNRIAAERDNLIDTHKLFKCLCGYCHSERRFALGERTGKLGGKRFEALKKYGYSYKNLVQFLRLCYAGDEFFQTGFFPVNMGNNKNYETLVDIKNNPQRFSKEEAIIYMDEAEKELKYSYDNVKVFRKFDEGVANRLCLDLYSSILKV